jgi:hypothetical protein
MLDHLLLLAALQIVQPVPSAVDTNSRFSTPDSTPAGRPARDTIPARPVAIDYSDAYNTRLTIHRIGSYTMLPLFAAEYSLGQNLLNDQFPPSWMRPAHFGVAGALGALFTINTVTGVWNLWDSREDPDGRSLRIVHSVLMLASDAGFAWTGALGNASHRNYQKRQAHKNAAIVSMGLSAAGTGLMWLVKR